MSGTAAAVRPRPASILSPVVDLLLVGGLSLIVFIPLLLSGMDQLSFVSLAALAWAQILVNMSHFMASYRIIYRDKAMILRHKWATIGIPLLLVLYIVLAIEQARTGPPLMVGFLIAISSGYLAWHYTGQVWGMMASFAYLEGIRFEPVERKLIRGSLRLLLAWHVVWAAHIWFNQTRLAEPAALLGLYRAISVGALAALGIGGLGIWKVRQRTGRLPPTRALVAWLAIFFWYAAMARWGLAGLFLVQLAHAIQYLEFPARVELNRIGSKTAGRAGLHMAVYIGALLVLSFIVTQFVPGPAMSSVAEFVGEDTRSVVPVLILTFINVHHYFTDGVIWKISNPEVRRELFAHVPAAVQPAASPAPKRADAASRGRRKKRKQAKR